MSDAQKRADKNWNKRNKEGRQYVNDRSAAKRFINKKADLSDLLELKNAVNGRLSIKMSKERILEAYNYFFNSCYTFKEVDEMDPKKWGDIVESAQENFEIAWNNDYFKVSHYDDFDDEPAIEGYTYVRSFYFGTTYYLFVKDDNGLIEV